MSTTIFCTFEQQDLADLAVGKLRNFVTGIKSIHYIGGYSTYSSDNSGAFGFNSWNGASGSGISPAAPSRPVTVKIVCSDASAPKVKSRLINMRAYQIITTG